MVSFECVIKVAVIDLDQISCSDDYLVGVLAEDLFVKYCLPSMRMVDDIGVPIKLLVVHVCHLCLDFFYRWFSECFAEC